MAHPFFLAWNRVKGHASVVDFLLSVGAIPGAKNAKGQVRCLLSCPESAFAYVLRCFVPQNAFDVAQGLVLRQTLMTAVLREEQVNGSAPVIAGATRDQSADAQRLRNLPPPPITGRSVGTLLLNYCLRLADALSPADQCLKLRFRQSPPLLVCR